MGQNKTKICRKNIKIFPEILDTNRLNFNKNYQQSQNNSDILHEEIFQNYKNIENDNRRESLNIVTINGKNYVKESDIIKSSYQLPDPNHDIFYGSGYKNE